MKKNTFFQIVLVLLFVVFSAKVSAQLSAFSLSVTTAPETCPGNGSLSFTTQNTTSGATIVYTIYHLPDIISPIATQSLQTLGGLVAGNYRVIATQSLGNESNAQQQDVSISYQVSPLTYSLTIKKTVCGNDGKLTVNIVSGNATTYEIFAGPAIRPLQSSNIFDNLPSGNYQVRVFDNCGEGVVQNFTIGALNANFTFSEYGVNPNLPGCNEVHVNNVLLVPTGSTIAYPLSIQYTVFPPAGAPIIINEVLSSGNPDQGSIGQDIPFFNNQIYSYQMKITDNCGNVFTSGQFFINESFEISLLALNASCNNKKLKIDIVYGYYPMTISFISAPSGFNPVNFNPSHPGPFAAPAFYGSDSNPVPAGNYQVQVTDACGHVAVSNISVSQNPSEMIVAVDVLPGCADDEASLGIITMDGVSELVSVNVISAPPLYPFSLPHNVSSSIFQGVFRANGYPIGDYTFSLVDSCGRQKQVDVYLPPLIVTNNNISVLEGCNSFGLSLYYDLYNAWLPNYWLQKYNPVTGLWGHPLTGNAAPGNITTTNALMVYNDIMNPNLAFSGTFRVLLTFHIVSPVPSEDLFCVREIYNFTYNQQPHIDDVFAFACESSITDVVLVANGVQPLTYRITEKNGQPFSIPDQNSAMFAGLEPAIYNFQVQDNCGNILNRLFDVTVPVELTVSPVQLCDGQPGSLTMSLFDFLDYSWWKGDDVSNILSTSNNLNFSSFNAAADSGIYHVRIEYPFTNSCIDRTLDFTISSAQQNPQAGNDTTANLCAQGIVDLSGLLSGSYDTYGIWTETTSSGSLNGALWDTAGLSAGNYQFKYTVEGFCGVFDEAVIDLNLKQIPETPVAFIEQIPCEQSALNLLATTIPDVTYSWTGPNGFTSSEQNPVIQNPSVADNGNYTVMVSNGDCESGMSTLEININPFPTYVAFSDCIEGRFMLQVLSGDSAQTDVSALTLSWNGPDNFSSAQNPVDITGLENGMYHVSLTTPEGCERLLQVEVGGTTCDIPKGVSPNNDGNNDSFDLSGLGEIQEVKIFNRYGVTVYGKSQYVDQWHGQDYNGNLLPSATYYYLVKPVNAEPKTGWVYLLHD
ncbi:T9SS type B sorting domain-containing protein [Flavobacterium silvaticum]|uniref:Gliding motility-associated C-terminal domain-containing protein n=1 Tax=Flavobacterium silvaticum TaxID=1852020 RepID=A0A972FX50_9FLAO|nr:gliding motility-associated C-terminal domain-containing protein [Flavobacterium silvaticum]NMH29647.1 gliding motility-associated C-terminal domain-containing protein [Flavobacterium silvaticum]